MMNEVILLAVLLPSSYVNLPYYYIALYLLGGRLRLCPLCSTMPFLDLA